MRTEQALPTVDTDGEPRRSEQSNGLGLLWAALLQDLRWHKSLRLVTMIFLISFCDPQKSRREVLTIGFAYTATVFFTYFAMGLGLKGILLHIAPITRYLRRSAGEHLDLRSYRSTEFQRCIRISQTRFRKDKPSVAKVG